jgi:hypothetical protein
METTTYPNGASRLALLLTIGLLTISTIVFSQSPTVTVRFANPAYDCLIDQYCLDVEFQANASNVELFGMNVRFFYDDTYMELDSFADFQGGYGPVMPDPPSVMMTLPGTGAAFGFPAPGVADFVNGAIQLVDNSQPPLTLSTTGWTKLFQVCFSVDGPVADSSNFCPPIVWDLEANPANGGYLPGDDGIASVWTPYAFYFEGKFSHCGVNSFQLMNVQGKWKITMITDTRRKTDCPTDREQIVAIDTLLNRWHHAAAVADEDAFFGLMTEEAIYIGTDATERWLRDELKEWSKEFFNRETAWAFTPLSRNTTIAPGGQIAWMDELLDTWMGTCRSTGILQRTNGEWKIIYYHLSVALPNDKLDGYRLLIGKG